MSINTFKLRSWLRKKLTEASRCTPVVITLLAHQLVYVKILPAYWFIFHSLSNISACRGQLKCDGTHAGTRFRLSAKRMSSFKSAGSHQFSRLLAAEVCASAVVMSQKEAQGFIIRQMQCCYRTAPNNGGSLSMADTHNKGMRCMTTFRSKADRIYNGVHIKLYYFYIMYRIL